MPKTNSGNFLFAVLTATLRIEWTSPSFKTSHPWRSLSQDCSLCLAAQGTDVEKLWNHCDCSEDQQNKMVLGEKKEKKKRSALLRHIVPRSGRRKLSATEDLTLYPLFFMTQTHWEVCSESSNTERIMLSLAAIAQATVSPVAISSGCFGIRLPLPPQKKLAAPAGVTLYIRPACAAVLILWGVYSRENQPCAASVALLAKVKVLVNWLR